MTPHSLRLLALIVVAAVSGRSPVALARDGKVDPLNSVAEKHRVSLAEMQGVYDEVRTPHKVGIVLRPAAGQQIDCPNVFRGDDAWYMAYVAITDRIG